MMEKRFLKNWCYNAALILMELEKIVKNNGGYLCSTWEYGGNVPEWVKNRKQYAITNRTLTGAIEETTATLKKIKSYGKASAETIAKYENELEMLKNIDNSPVTTPYGDYRYIAFVLDNNYYYFQIDDNPFFEFYFTKNRIENGKMYRNAYLQNDKKEWLFDCFFSYKCSGADRREAANLIFNMLMNSNYSKTYKDASRKEYTNIIVIEE